MIAQLAAIASGILGLILFYSGSPASVPFLVIALLLFIAIDLFGLVSGRLGCSPFALAPLLPMLFVRPWFVGLTWGFVVIGGIDATISAVKFRGAYLARPRASVLGKLERQMRPHDMSKGLFFWSVLAAYAVVLVFDVLAHHLYGYGDFVFYPAIAAMIYIVVVFLMFLYRAWSAIQDGHARTTPGRAVGFIFIPIYNVYWLFQAVWGFALDYNALLDRRSLDLRRLPVGVFLAYCICLLLYWVPVVGVLATFGAMVLLLILVWRTCDAVTALPHFVSSGVSSSSEQPN